MGMKVIHVVIRDPSKAIANDLGLKALKVVLKVSRMTKKKFPKTLTVKKKTQIKKMQRNQTKNKIFLKLTQNIHVMGLAVLHDAKGTKEERVTSSDSSPVPASTETGKGDKSS